MTKEKQSTKSKRLQKEKRPIKDDRLPKEGQAIEGERLQKVLANQGLGSRREIERWIEADRIKLNGKPVKLGDRYKSGDRLFLDGKPVRIKGAEHPLILGMMYYKPEGEVATRSDEKGRKTIFDSLPACEYGRWINVGRLDLNTSGLMILTNNGELANHLMHPKYQMSREYAVRVLGEVSEKQIQNMLDGVELEDGLAKFEMITDAGGKGSNHWYHVSLREGRNREVRRLWESQDIRVSRLIRIRFGAIKLDQKLKAGQYRELSPAELNQLLNETGLPTLKPHKVVKKKRSSAWPGGKPVRKKATASKKVSRKRR
ncbi:MAG: rRNA pseudouridine synthase [Gammaproteobacteria bacterium]|nr:rRNA pseudouridine synthase [Gammaproteobacteria bacterium]